MAVCRVGTAVSWFGIHAPRSSAHSTTTPGMPVARAHDGGLLGALAARASGNPLAAMPCTYDRSNRASDGGRQRLY
jgi:hypothetical protein